MRQIAPGVWVSPQLAPGAMTALVGLGVKRVINNRPDAEEPGQPTSAEMEMAAKAAGLEYLWIPVRGMPDPAQAGAVQSALADNTPSLLFCRSGTRSAAAWAMARRALGDDPSEIRAAAAQAGYDFTQLPL